MFDIANVWEIKFGKGTDTVPVLCLHPATTSTGLGNIFGRADTPDPSIRP